MNGVGFEFKGIYSKDMGVIMKTTNRPILPEQKRYEIDIPLADGSVDFSASNALKRNVYNDRIIELELAFVDNDIYTLQQHAAKIAVWLTGAGELRFDDMNFAHWKAKVIQGVDFTPILLGKAARIKVYFKCAAWAVNDFSTSGPILDQEIALDSPIPLDMSLYFTSNLHPGENEILVNNFGSWYTKPIFHFAGTGNSVRVSLPTYEEFQVHVTHLFTMLKIDCEKQRVYDDAEDITRYVSGNFFELPPSPAVPLIVDWDGEEGATLFVEYMPKWVYGADMESTFVISEE